MVQYINNLLQPSRHWGGRFGIHGCLNLSPVALRLKIRGSREP